MVDKAALPGDLALDRREAEDLRRILDALDLIAAERLRLHGGDDQGMVMRLLVRRMIDGDASGMPLLRLARETGIPRETLRRKLGPLLNRHYLVQDENGRYCVGAAYLEAIIRSRQAVVEALDVIAGRSIQS